MFTNNEILNETYQIMHPIGAGGSGSVYLAYHLRLQKYVVIKQLRGAFSSDFLMRTEVDILKNLHHPYLPQVYDFLQNGEDVYTVIDYVDGSDLQAYIQSGTRLSEAHLKRFLRQIAEVLSYLHTQNPPVIHSDIKPGNIIINQNGDAVLIDFNTSIGGNQGNILGLTLPYAAPEQAQLAQYALYGQPAPYVLDGRADLFSLGATFYELICGIRPTYGQPPVPLSDMNLPDYSPEFLKLIDRMMAYDRDKRISSAKKLMTAVDRMDVRYRKMVVFRCVSVLASAALIASGSFCLIRGLRQNQSEHFTEYYTNAVALVSQGNLDDAKAALEAILADASCRAYIQKEPDQAARVYHAYGDVYYYREEYAAAANYYKQAIDRCSNPERSEDYPLYIRDAALAFAQSGDAATAQQMLQLAQQFHVADDDLLLIQTVLEANAGHLEQCFDRAHRLLNESQNDEVRFRAAFVAASVSETLEDRIYWLTKAEQYDAGNTAARGLAVAYAQQAQQTTSDSARDKALRQAAETYKKLCSSVYASTNDRVNYSVVLRMAGRYDEAIYVLQQVAPQDAEQYRVLANLCFAYYEMGDDANASLYCSKALLAWNADHSADKPSETGAEYLNLQEIAQRYQIGGG